MPNYRHDLPANYYFGGGDATSAATPLAIIALLVASILILVLPRKYAYLPFIVAAFLVPTSVVLLIGSLHLNATRILVLVGWLSIWIRRDRFPGRMQTFDKLILAYALCDAVAYSLHWHDFGAAVNRAGFFLTTMGSYFLLRFLVTSKEDVVRVIKAFGIAVIVIAPVMLYEHLFSFNAFWLFGAPDLVNLRNGQVRAQGPFAHAIIAGTVGAVLFPLFVGLYRIRPRDRALAIASAAASMIMVVAARSSTPVLTFAAALFALGMWPARKKLQQVRWGLVVVLLLVQLSMSAPIWFIMLRASAVIGGSGWHRSMLIDNFVHHFPQWWLMGTQANPDWGWSMWDVDNAYVGAGISGGLLSFVLFIAEMVFAYKLIGRSRKLTEKQDSEQKLIWAIGCALFANTAAYFGIVYFDQAVVMWYAILTMIVVSQSFVPKKQESQKAENTVRLQNWHDVLRERWAMADKEPEVKGVTRWWA